MAERQYLTTPPRFLFFTGKGGVGKTSIACATAVRLADQGLRVLLVSTDPASNLAEVLGTPVGSQHALVAGAPGLVAVNVDPEAAAEAYRDRILTPLAGTLADDELRAAREQLSGFCTTEVAAFDEFTTYLTQPSAGAATGAGVEFDHIVFDTAPTGHTIRLLQLPGAWTSFLAAGKGDTSCLGPLAGLDKNRRTYATALAELRDPRRARIVLVTRAQPSALVEAARTAVELTEAGIIPTHLVVNGLLPHSVQNESDSLYRAMRDREQETLSRMPTVLSRLTADQIEFSSAAPLGLAGLRGLLDRARSAPVEARPDMSSAALADDRQGLDAVVEELEAAGHGLVLCMGKGGVGKTTVAAAVAVALADRGHPVHLSTTDPAAHLDQTLPDRVAGLTVSRIDPTEAIAEYRAHVMATKGRDVSADERAALSEDLRSPCNDEIAVFTQFAKVIREARRGYVVLDTAPTGHTLLLLDATGSYHRDAVRLLGPDATGYRTPLMMLQDSSLTRVLIVTTPEQTPVSEAAALQDDLRRAGITPWGWVVNNSLAAAHPTSPLLRRRAVDEDAQLRRVDRLAARVTVLPALPEDPVGHHLLAALIHAPSRPSPDRRTPVNTIETTTHEPADQPSRDPDTVRGSVREHYAQLLETGASGCCTPSTAAAPAAGTPAASCCGADPVPVSLTLGYTPEDLSSVPAGADLGIGCGNPHALARIEPGMTVLDLGCGAGFDVFLAARSVGEQGHVIGVDLTPEMLTKARANAAAGGYTNVDFRLGEIEHLPVADASVDVVISNCVINLSPDKQAVFDEAHRVLRPGARLAVSDVVATADIPDDVRTDPDLYASCVAGASTVSEVRAMLQAAGFTDIEIRPVDHSRAFISSWVPGRNVADYLVSADIEAMRPVGA